MKPPPQKLPHAAVTHVSVQLQGDRHSQEDSFIVAELGPSSSGERRWLILVADGVGGHFGGKFASQTVVETVFEQIQQSPSPESELALAVESANTRLMASIAERPELRKMGTTLIAVLLVGNCMYWVSVGDSLLLEFESGTLRQLNADHSMKAVFARLVQTGEMTADEAAEDPMRHALTSVLGGAEIDKLEHREEAYAMKQGAVYLVASDGICTISDAALCNLLGRYDGKNLQAVADSITEQIKKSDSQEKDNATFVLFSSTPQRSGQSLQSPTPVRGVKRRLAGLRLAFALALVAVILVLADTVRWYVSKIDSEPEPGSFPPRTDMEQGDLDEQ